MSGFWSSTSFSGGGLIDVEVVNPAAFFPPSLDPDLPGDDGNHARREAGGASAGKADAKDDRSSGAVDRRHAVHYDHTVITETQKKGWNAKYEALVAFKKETGHCRVPHKHPVLGTWANDQKRHYKKKDGAEQAKRDALLGALGFERPTNLEDAFNAKFDALAAFKRGAGHCGVPRSHPVLGKWVTHLRMMYKQNGGALPGDRAARLDALGFAFEPGRSGGGCNDVRWEARCEELEDYKRRHGHCDVPIRYGSNFSLGHWVAKQRALYRRGTLAAEREVHLRDLGFGLGTRRRGRRPAGGAGCSGAGEGKLAQNTAHGRGRTATHSAPGRTSPGRSTNGGGGAKEAGKKDRGTSEGMESLLKQLAEARHRTVEMTGGLATALDKQSALQRELKDKERKISDLRDAAVSSTAKLSWLKHCVESAAQESNAQT